MLALSNGFLALDFLVSFRFIAKALEIRTCSDWRRLKFFNYAMEEAEPS